MLVVSGGLQYSNHSRISRRSPEVRQDSGKSGWPESAGDGSPRAGTGSGHTFLFAKATQQGLLGTIRDYWGFMLHPV